MEHPSYNHHMDRFWSKVTRSDGCWDWTGAHFIRMNGQTSYGMFLLDGKLIGAHRVAWMLTNGPIPDGVLVLHHCDNQQCVRPDHLYLGSHADNTRDAVTRRRMHDGERCWNHKLSDDDVLAVRSLIDAGLPTEEIGRRMGVSGRTVRYIRSGERWKHVA